MSNISDVLTIWKKIMEQIDVSPNSNDLLNEILRQFEDLGKKICAGTGLSSGQSQARPELALPRDAEDKLEEIREWAVSKFVRFRN